MLWQTYQSLLFTDWYRGFLARDRMVKGIFPKQYVCIKECTIEQIGLVTFLLDFRVIIILLCAFDSVVHIQFQINVE